MKKHTPGPWIAKSIKTPYHEEWTVHPATGGIAYIAALHYSHHYPAEAEANARLITAAPEMLELLRRHLEAQTDWASPEYYNQRAAAKALIAWIEGSK